MVDGDVGVAQQGLPLLATSETTEQHELLVDLGCDLGQGYLLGRPLDADGASQLVHRAAVD